MIKSTLAVAGDAEVLTSQGPHRVADLVGRSVDVWSGEEFLSVTVRNLGPRDDWMILRFRDPAGQVHALEVLDGHGILVGDPAVASLDCLAAKDLPMVTVVMRRAPGEVPQPWRRVGTELLDQVKDAYSIDEEATPVQVNGIPSL